MATTTTRSVGAQGGMLEPQDITFWQGRLKEFFADPQQLTAPAPAGRRTWNFRMFECFNPIDECLITCCCPCITFGKVHHRLHKDPKLTGYSPLNASCLGFFLSSYCGLHWFPLMLQRSDMRSKYNLDGTMLEDFARACCCACCDLVQESKESALREGEMAKQVVHEPYQTPAQDMQYMAKN
ncbi:MAG: hypothetical protein M1826_002915 [Phylliscum demangeonii]|nr:MAG: hypothetical protein M1826_002915 [Phylliscum demangeonii]